MEPPGRACGRNDMVGLLEPPPTSSIPGRANRAPLSPRIPGCQSAFKFDPAYCLICECYPDSAVGADDPTSANRLSLSAIEACSTAGTVGGSGP
jgi:hypothetical protein